MTLRTPPGPSSMVKMRKSTASSHSVANSSTPRSVPSTWPTGPSSPPPSTTASSASATHPRSSPLSAASAFTSRDFTPLASAVSPAPAAVSASH